MANYRQVARRAAQRYGLDPGVFERQIQQESGFNPGARSPAGAVGIAQIMPGTARGWGVDPTDPRAALNAAAKNMARYVHQYGSYKNALVAYNAGPGRVGGSLPAETRNYINVILGGRNPSTSGVSPSAGSPGTPGTTITDTHLAFDPGAAQAAPGLKLPARPQPQITAPTAPDFAARAVTPTGYQAPEAPASSPAKAARFDAGQTLEALQALSSGGTKTVKTTATVGGTPGTPASGGSRAPGPRLNVRAGVPVARLTSEGGGHETAGLPGYPAHDFMAPAGSAAVAPVSGKVVKLSGHNPAGGPTQGPHGPLGWSAYIRGDDGNTYYLTHMGTRSLQVGQRVKQGQKIGTVANYHKYGTPDHIHMGVSG